VYNFLIIILQFFSGAVMYSYIFANIKNIDIRSVRDGNPGASNLWRAAGKFWGIAALIMDYAKGLFPVILFYKELNSYILSIALLAGIAGHAFSPMLKFKGGKAIAVSFGAWTVMTRGEVPIIMGIIFTLRAFFNRGKKISPEEDFFTVFITYIILSPYILYNFFTGRKEFLILYTGNFLIIIYKHYKEFKNILKKNKS